MIHFALAIFLSAFLLFQVQPLIARFILPWFGGTPSVWTSCMLFFQVVLLLGYGYAHVLNRYLPTRKQFLIHVTLLLVSFLFLPIIPSEYWKPDGEKSPVLGIVLLLSVTIGIPYVLLSATSPLLQAWFSRSYPDRSPFRLFALSNFGSLLALFSYPFLFEPNLRLTQQATTWSAGYFSFALICSFIAYRSSRLELANADQRTTGVTASKPNSETIALWLMLSAFPSVLLLATTSQICQEVAVTPFLWILPLGLYLITFIISFDGPRWYNRTFFGLAMIAFCIIAGVLYAKGVSMAIWLQLIGYNGALFFCAMMCHGELARRKPDPAHLTMFYLVIALGGALGGGFTAVVAPMIFTTYFEFPIAIVGCFAAAGLSVVMDNEWYLNRRLPYPVRVLILVVMVGALTVGLSQPDSKRASDADLKTRDFHGTLYVSKFTNGRGDYLTLTNGRIQHGVQFLAPALRTEPVSYYGYESGVGIAYDLMGQMNPEMRSGVVGLGAGVIAAYGRPQDEMIFYELNPAVDEIARSQFFYLDECQADWKVKLGDARINLERDVSNDAPRLDLLSVDAFSSDAIPTHLLTRECFAVYRQRLAVTGVLCVHVSNRFLNLEPVVYALARDQGLECRTVDYDPPESEEDLHSSSTWILVSSSKDFLDAFDELSIEQPEVGDLDRYLWTDDFSSLWTVMKRSSWRDDINEFLSRE